MEWLEEMRLKLRELLHLIEKRRRNVYTNFQDELGELEEIELIGASNEQMDLGRYRQKICRYRPVPGTRPPSVCAETSS